MQNEDFFLIVCLKNWRLSLKLHTKLHTFSVNIFLKIRGGGGGRPYVQVNVLN